MATLEQRLRDLVTVIGTDFKTIMSKIGDTASLNTTAKTVVTAINEVNQKPSGTGGASIADGDTGTSTTTTYSASKITALNAAQDTVINGKANTSHTHTLSQITDAATKANDAAVVHLAGTETITGTKSFSSATPISFTAAPAVPDGAFAIAKVATLQTELNSRPKINDAALVTDSTAAAGIWSPAKITLQIKGLEDKLVGGAAGAFDTFKELQDLMAADDTEAAAFSSALQLRVRFDAAQTLTTAQLTQVKANLGGYYTATEIGNPDTDLVAVYAAAKL